MGKSKTSGARSPRQPNWVASLPESSQLQHVGWVPRAEIPPLCAEGTRLLWCPRALQSSHTTSPRLGNCYHDSLKYPKLELPREGEPWSLSKVTSHGNRRGRLAARVPHGLAGCLAAGWAVSPSTIPRAPFPGPRAHWRGHPRQRRNGAVSLPPRLNLPAKQTKPLPELSPSPIAHVCACAFPLWAIPSPTSVPGHRATPFLNVVRGSKRRPRKCHYFQLV